MALGFLMIVGAMGVRTWICRNDDRPERLCSFWLVHIHCINYHYAFPWRSRANRYVSEKK